MTHTRKSRSAFDGYHSVLHGERTCAEIAKLRRHPARAIAGVVVPMDKPSISEKVQRRAWHSVSHRRYNS